ncbi:MAG: CotH kinase family protein, partial [Prolixibacteraceae bacterium]
NSTGTLIDQTNAVELSEDQSLGRYPDGSGTWLPTFFVTPGKTNNSVNHILFSAEEGFYNSPFHLHVNSLNGDTVFYTTDGSVPDQTSFVFPESLLMDYTCSSPNVISEISSTPPQSQISYKCWESPGTVIHKANILRCASYRNGTRTSKIYTHTFFVDSAISGKFSIPVLSLVTDAENLFNYDSGIYVPGKYFNPENPEWTGNYFNKGAEWEKPVHIAYFENDGEPAFSQDAGIRIHGFKTRQTAQKSLRLYARKEYGEKNFDYRLLPQKENDEYKRFILRTTMGDWWSSTVINDILAREIAGGLNIETQDHRPVAIYLNGEYWGMYSLRDRIDERYISYTFNIDKDSVDIINGNYGLVDAGSNEHYIKLAEFVESNDLSFKSNYEYVQSQIDIDNFIDYLISQMFFANVDWPGNNQRLWRPQTPGGKWRWILFDVDAGFGNVNRNMFEFSFDNTSGLSWRDLPVSTFLFKNLLNNDDFMKRFLERYAEVLHTEFNTERMVEKLEKVKKMYEAELPHHISRWNYPESFSRWENDIENELLSFIVGRPCAVAENITEFFNISDFGFKCGTGNKTQLANKLFLAPNPCNGSFFIQPRFAEITLNMVSMVDVNGKTIWSGKNIHLSKGETKHFNFEGLQAGMYYLKCNSGRHIETHKIVIMN